MQVGLVLGEVETTAEDARATESRGFDYVAAGEHVFFHQAAPNSFVTLAAAAGATSRIRLLSSVAVLPLYAPALAAKLVATLDRVSGGRLELGVGGGGEYPAEFDACGVDVGTRFRRLDEALELLDLLSAGGRVSYDGEFGRLDDVALEPPPVQRPRPPIWVGGRRPGARRRAARRGDVWFPYMVTPEMLSEGLQDVRAQAAELGRPGVVRGAVFAWVCVDEDGRWARATGIEAVSATYRQDFAPLADRYLILGDPAAVTARLLEFETAGAEAAILAVAAASPARRGVVDTLAAQVLPALQRP